MIPEQQKIEIKQNFSKYEILQQEQIKILQTQALPDLDSMTKERSETFLSLKQSLDKFIETINFKKEYNTLEELTSFEKRIKMVSKLDEILGNEIQKHKDKLKKHLSQLKLGKKALTGYQHANASDNKPHVFSMSR